MEALPFDLDLYFNRTAGSQEIALDLLIPAHTRSFSIEDAERHMRNNAQGCGNEKRAPISIQPRSDGCYNIKDGSSTYAVAKASGWPRILVEIQ